MGITETRRKQREGRSKPASNGEAKTEETPTPPEPDMGHVTGTGRISRHDPPIERLDTPEVTKAVVRAFKGRLEVRCTKIEDAESYEWELRRGPGFGLSHGRTSEKPKTEWTDYPIGVNGVPQVRVRAISGAAISVWSDWRSSEHDLGNLD